MLCSSETRIVFNEGGKDNRRALKSCKQSKIAQQGYLKSSKIWYTIRQINGPNQGQ